MSKDSDPREVTNQQPTENSQRVTNMKHQSQKLKNSIMQLQNQQLSRQKLAQNNSKEQSEQEVAKLNALYQQQTVEKLKFVFQEVISLIEIFDSTAKNNNSTDNQEQYDLIQPIICENTIRRQETVKNQQQMLNSLTQNIFNETHLLNKLNSSYAEKSREAIQENIFQKRLNAITSKQEKQTALNMAISDDNQSLIEKIQDKQNSLEQLYIKEKDANQQIQNLQKIIENYQNQFQVKEQKKEAAILNLKERFHKQSIQLQNGVSDFNQSSYQQFSRQNAYLTKLGVRCQQISEVTLANKKSNETLDDQKWLLQAQLKNCSKMKGKYKVLKDRSEFEQQQVSNQISQGVQRFQKIADELVLLNKQNLTKKLCKNLLNIDVNQMKDEYFILMNKEKQANKQLNLLKEENAPINVKIDEMVVNRRTRQMEIFSIAKIIQEHKQTMNQQILSLNPMQQWKMNCGRINMLNQRIKLIEESRNRFLEELSKYRIKQCKKQDYLSTKQLQYQNLACISQFENEQVTQQFSENREQFLFNVNFSYD